MARTFRVMTSSAGRALFPAYRSWRSIFWRCQTVYIRLSPLNFRVCNAGILITMVQEHCFCILRRYFGLDFFSKSNIQLLGAWARISLIIVLHISTLMIPRFSSGNNSIFGRPRRGFHVLSRRSSVMGFVSNGESFVFAKSVSCLGWGLV